MQTAGHGCIPIKFYLRTLKFEFGCFRILLFFLFGPWVVQKQVEGQIWPVGSWLANHWLRMHSLVDWIKWDICRQAGGSQARKGLKPGWRSLDVMPTAEEGHGRCWAGLWECGPSRKTTQEFIGWMRKDWLPISAMCNSGRDKGTFILLDQWT